MLHDFGLQTTTTAKDATWRYYFEYMASLWCWMRWIAGRIINCVTAQMLHVGWFDNNCLRLILRYAVPFLYVLFPNCNWRSALAIFIEVGTMVAIWKHGGSSCSGAGRTFIMGARMDSEREHTHDKWKMVGDPWPQAHFTEPGWRLCLWSRSGVCRPAVRRSLRIFKRGLGSKAGSTSGNKLLSNNFWIWSASWVRISMRDVVRCLCTPCSMPRKCWPRSIARVFQVTCR